MGGGRPSGVRSLPHRHPFLSLLSLSFLNSPFLPPVSTSLSGLRLGPASALLLQGLGVGQALQKELASERMNE